MITKFEQIHIEVNKTKKTANIIINQTYKMTEEEIKECRKWSIMDWEKWIEAKDKNLI